MEAAFLHSGIVPVAIWQIIRESSAFGVFILIALTFMSVVSWIVIFHKWRQFKAVDHDSERFQHFFRRSATISEVSSKAASYPSAPSAHMYMSGTEELNSLRELARSHGKNGDTLSDKDFDVLEMTMERALTHEMGKLESRVVFLAVTASAAPFMGLLGTVVGIMDSFWAIGERGSASLAIVAPGIAEALLATIVGLGAAIPAVIAYNWANNKTKFIHDQSNGFILEFLARSKKELG